MRYEVPISRKYLSFPRKYIFFVRSELKQRTAQGPDIHKREYDLHVPDRDNVDSGLVLQQRTRLDKRTRGNKQLSPDRDNVGSRYVLKQRTTHDPVTRIQGDKAYSLDRDNVGPRYVLEIGLDKVQLHERSGTNFKVLTVITLAQNIGQNNGPCRVRLRVNGEVTSTAATVRSPERARERRRGSHRGGHRDSLNRVGSLKMSPKIVKQEDGPSSSDLDSADQDLEYMSKNWTKSPGTRRHNKARDRLDRAHLSKDQAKLRQQDRA